LGEQENHVVEDSVDLVVVSHLGGRYVQVLEPLGGHVAVGDEEDFQCEDYREEQAQTSPHYGDRLEEFR